MGTDSNHCGFNKKQRRMAYQSSPKKKQRTITGDGSTGIAIRMGNNSTGNVCKVCRAKATQSVIPHSAHNQSASNCSLYDGGNSKTKPKQKNMASFLNPKAVSSIVPPPYAARASNNVAVNTNTNKNTNNNNTNNNVGVNTNTSTNNNNDDTGRIGKQIGRLKPPPPNSKK